MSEGGLEAPERHALGWRDPEFYDLNSINTEFERVFDICHGCRRCHNLCDSFPKLFNLIDESETGELDSVNPEDYGVVAEACTLCDMCFMTKCPYVPPHPFQLDFPHLMLRAKAQEFQRGERSWQDKALAETDRNGKLASAVSPLANWSTRRKNKLTRPILEKICHVHRDAELPEFHKPSLEKRAEQLLPVNSEAPAFGRKAVLYATCYGNFNNQDIGEASRTVLARNGVETTVVHPGCCGMPKLENGDLESVAKAAHEIAGKLASYIEEGYDIIGLTPSCVLMLKFEWPLIVPEDENVGRLAEAIFDISEYVVDIARREGLVEPTAPLEGGVAVHLACHARAQNIGPKAAEMLKLVSRSELTLVERCSGHGGKWGTMKKFFETAIKLGNPAARRLQKSGAAYMVSECPLAALHLGQCMEGLDEGVGPRHLDHPIQLVAMAYENTKQGA
jgi:glycerol-3-phosphate dehydrogenase subunit C